MDKRPAEPAESGQPARFDRTSGAVFGSGSGAGGGNPGEDHDGDPMAGSGAKPAAGTGHPLPASDEARHEEIPESLEEAKGEGDDGKAATRTGAKRGPDGEAYCP